LAVNQNYCIPPESTGVKNIYFPFKQGKNGNNQFLPIKIFGGFFAMLAASQSYERHYARIEKATTFNGNMLVSTETINRNNLEELMDERMQTWEDSQPVATFMLLGNRIRQNGNSYRVPLINQRAMYKWCVHNYLIVSYSIIFTTIW
jgi:hypothetical protein